MSGWDAGPIVEIDSFKNDAVVFRSWKKPQLHVSSRQKTHAFGDCFISNRSLISQRHKQLPASHLPAETIEVQIEDSIPQRFCRLGSSL